LASLQQHCASGCHFLPSSSAAFGRYRTRARSNHAYGKAFRARIQHGSQDAHILRQPADDEPPDANFAQVYG